MNNTRTQSKATTPASVRSTQKYTSTKSTTRKSPIRTTTDEMETTTNVPSSKNPRIGDNNITDTPGEVTPVDDLISTTTDSQTTEDTTTESMDRTTLAIATKRPSTRVETTLEIDDGRLLNISTSTEAMETTTNPVLTVTEGSNETSTSVSLTTCKYKKDCAKNEICLKKECIKVCDTNGNVTKLSDDCVKGTNTIILP